RTGSAALDANSASDPSLSLTSAQIAEKLKELQMHKDAAKDIINCGERLTTALVQEEEVRNAREQALQFLNAITKNVDGGASANTEPSKIIRREIVEQLQSLTQSGM